MHAEISHQNNFTFQTKIRDHVFTMDTQLAAGGNNQGPSPKEMMLASIIGCTGMDVIVLLKKHRMTVKKLLVTGDAEPRTEHPKIFKDVAIVFDVEGPDITSEVLNDAVNESMTKFCGVSAMVSKVSPIHYSVLLNGTNIGKGAADFPV